MKKKKREDLQSNRYSQFRQEFDDIFETLIIEKRDKESESNKMNMEDNRMKNIDLSQKESKSI